MDWPLFVCCFLHVCCLPCLFLSTSTSVWQLLQFSCCNILLCICMLHVQFLCTSAVVCPLLQFYTSFLQSWKIRPLGLSNCCACTQKWMVDEIAKNLWFPDNFVRKNWTVWRRIATFVHLHAHFGHDSFWIAFVIEIVIAFVMPTLAQINFTIASTTQIVPLSLCMSAPKWKTNFVFALFPFVFSKWNLE